MVFYLRAIVDAKEAIACTTEFGPYSIGTDVQFIEVDKEVLDSEVQHQVIEIKTHQSIGGRFEMDCPDTEIW